MIPPDDDPLIGALVLELTELRDKVTGLEQARSTDQVKLADLSTLLHNTIVTMTGDQQPPRSRTQTAYGRDGGFDDDGRYQPAPAPQWWRLTGDERDQVLVRLRWWVGVVFRPGYGHLATQLADCWAQHDLCLYLLDLLSQLHTLLYQAEPGPGSEQEGELLQRPAGVLTSAAEWHLRLLPAAVTLMKAETKGCPHQRAQVTDWGTHG